MSGTHIHTHTYTHIAHTLGKNTSSLTVYSRSPMNKEMNHTETNSSAGVIRPDLAPLMMVRDSLYLGQMSSPTSTTCVLLQKGDKRQKDTVLPTQSSLCPEQHTMASSETLAGVGGRSGHRRVMQIKSQHSCFSSRNTLPS